MQSDILLLFVSKNTSIIYLMTMCCISQTKIKHITRQRMEFVTRLLKTQPASCKNAPPRCSDDVILIRQLRCMMTSYVVFGRSEVPPLRFHATSVKCKSYTCSSVIYARESRRGKTQGAPSHSTALDLWESSQHAGQIMGFSCVAFVACSHVSK